MSESDPDPLEFVSEESDSFLTCLWFLDDDLDFFSLTRARGSDVVFSRACLNPESLTPGLGTD